MQIKAIHSPMKVIEHSFPLGIARTPFPLVFEEVPFVQSTNYNIQ